MKETQLIIDIIGKGTFFAPYSARECVQTLTPLSQGSLRRTINGTLCWVGSRTHRKFRSTISCKDKASPAFEGLWRGDLVTITCLQTLTQSLPPGQTNIQLERPGVDLRLYDAQGNLYPAQTDVSRKVILPSGFPGGFITYAPILIMMVEDYHLEMDEWEAGVGWRLVTDEQ